MTRPARKPVPQTPLLFVVPPSSPQSVKAGRRAVLLLRGPRDGDLDMIGAWCGGQGLTVHAVTRDARTALDLLAQGRADTIVCISAADLFPAVRVLTALPGEVDDPERRRPRRLHARG